MERCRRNLHRMRRRDGRTAVGSRNGRSGIALWSAPGPRGGVDGPPPPGVRGLPPVCPRRRLRSVKLGPTLQVKRHIEGPERAPQRLELSARSETGFHVPRLSLEAVNAGVQRVHLVSGYSNVPLQPASDPVILETDAPLLAIVRPISTCAPTYHRCRSMRARYRVIGAGCCEGNQPVDAAA